MTPRGFATNSLLPFSLVLFLAMGLRVAQASDSPEVVKEKERKLINILTSDAPPEDKAVPCKQLAIYGSKECVPALAPLLLDPKLASWARIALEAIPDPAADEALRRAIDKVQGNLLIGVINSIGTRRDSQAAPALVKKLRTNDLAVSSAAAVALGHIGGEKAAKALLDFLPSAPTETREAVAEGAILSAEKLLAEGKRKQAEKIYSVIRKADVPKQRLLEATRGEILAKGSAGLPLLIEQLRSPDKGFLAIGLHTARELPGKDVTEALGAEMRKAPPDRQAYLLLAISDRNESESLPLVIEAARNGSALLRLVAVGILDRHGNVSSVPVLLDAAAGSDEALSEASLTALARLPGNKVDSEVLTRLPQSNGRMRQVLIELAARRRTESALPTIVASTTDSSAGVRNAAVQTIGVLGSEKQIPDLVTLLTRTKDSKARGNIEMALIEISERSGSACAPNLLPLAGNSDPSLRAISLHALASAGGPAALQAVRTAVEDSDESVRDEAVRTLSTWPNNWPDDSTVAEPLLELARSGKNMTQQVLGMRGYLQCIKGDKAFKDDDRVTKVNAVLPLLKRPEEKRLAIAAVDGIPTQGALDLLMNFAAQDDVVDDACSAILNVTGKSAAGLPRDQKQKALETVAAKATNASTKKRAEDLLKKLL
jgi:HEAT repeat protein